MVEKHISLAADLQTLLILVWNTMSHIAIYVTKVESFRSALCCVIPFITRPKQCIL